ncbi:MAG TPA: hypothetical protein PKX99_01825 [Thermoanaerobaculia bacterium]|nr:hypothetical protein [Thermoanaerobaculia bacterium]
MRVSRLGPAAFSIEFATEEELFAEHRAHLGAGGLRLPCDGEELPLFAPLALTLRLAGREEVAATARVVGNLGVALAVALDGPPAALLDALLAAAPVAAPAAPSAAPEEDPEESDSTPEGTLWERLRSLNRNQRLLLAPKAGRAERALLVQESDAQVLFALLKNPRLTLDEVVRVAKSSFLSFQMAELILKTSQWIGNLDVRLALVHNPKTPVPFALRLLPTLPDAEVRAIAKGAATSMALKQAALKRVQGYS